MAITTTSCNSEKGQTSAEFKNEKICNYTEMQKHVAENAIKLPSENNPIATLRFSADPTVLVYNDTLYVYGTNDSQQLEYTKGKESNGYNKINTLNCLSTKDLVNWTDEGIIYVAGKENPKGPAKWATNSWAPAICCKKINGKDKFFLYFADSANGIGVLTADSPTGPFIDPIGKALISRSETPNTEGVHWLFDPAVIVDDDGKGYLYYGGGIQEDPVHPKSARCVALNDDMISLACDPIQLDPPYLFEDSGINKIGNKYYYSYCSNFIDRQGATGFGVSPVGTICYMTSDKPLGPYTYAGYTLHNPAIYFGPGGNNHHWIFQFKNKWYIAYHTQTLEQGCKLEKGGYRNIFIDEFLINEDGSLPIQKGTKEGVAQICNFDPCQKVPAATFNYNVKVLITDDLTVTPIANNAYFAVKGVDFSKKPSTITFTSVNEKSNGSVKVVLDQWSGSKVISEVTINGKGDFTGSINFPEGEDSVRNVYFVMNGSLELASWQCK